MRLPDRSCGVKFFAKLLFGTIEAGKTADMVLLDANPLENISNTRRIFAVIRNGQYLDRAALGALLARARAAAASAPPAK